MTANDILGNFLLISGVGYDCLYSIPLLVGSQSSGGYGLRIVGDVLQGRVDDKGFV
jgi:hypothetical protein